MFFILSKILALFSSPINIVFLILIIGLLQYKKYKKTKYIKISLILFSFFSNGFISNQILKLLEEDPVEMDSVKHYDYGIMLSGVTQHNSALKDRISYTQGVNRLYHTFNLYKKGKIDKILVTGGNGKVLSDDLPEAEKLTKTLLEWGVPKDDILTENKAQNTYQNAVNSVKMIPQNSSAIIITSAFHMRRSKKCFDKTSYRVDIFPTDYYTTKTLWTPQELFFPTPTAFKRWSIISHETLGMISYKIAGYI